MNKKWHITFNSPVVLTFVIICFIVMIVGYLTGGRSNQVLFMTYSSPRLMDPLTYVRLFTHSVGHVSWDHFIGNMMYILLLGPMLEEKYGSKAIIEVILLTSLTIGVVNWALFPGVAIIGASGIVFAFILMTSFTGFREGEIPVTVILVAVLYLGQQLYQGLFIQDNVSQMGHIVGGLVGAAAGYLLNRKRDVYRGDFDREQ